MHPYHEMINQFSVIIVSEVQGSNPNLTLGKLVSVSKIVNTKMSKMKKEKKDKL